MSGGLRDWKSNNVRAYFLQHPEASISQAARDMQVSTRTAAQVRSELAAKGLVPAGRNRKVDKRVAPVLPPAFAVEVPPTQSDGGHLLDDKAIRAMADPSMDLADLDLDDEETRKKLLREVKRIAFSPESHPDVRLSATQVWLKLKDMAKSRELGPGKPLTRAAAIARLVDLLKMTGPEIAIQAMYEAFNVKGPENGQNPNVDDSNSGETPVVGGKSPTSELPEQESDEL